MSELIIETGKQKGRRIPIPLRRAIIGRDEGAFLRLGSANVSREHCVLMPTARGIMVRDLGSENGTLVNGVVIQAPTLLQSGDILQVGPLQFRFESNKAERGAYAIENVVADWLNDSESSLERPAAGDTAIVKGRGDAPPSESAGAAESTTPRTPPAAHPAAGERKDRESAAPSPNLGPVPAAREQPGPVVPHAVAGRSTVAPRGKFATIAEEARDIFHRHLEQQEAKRRESPPGKQ